MNEDINSGNNIPTEKDINDLIKETIGCNTSCDNCGLD